MTKKMGMLLMICLLCVGAAFFAFAREGSTERASDIALKGFNVESTTLAALHEGKPVYVNFWATWCPPCVKELPHIETMYQKYGDRVNFAAISVDTEEQALEAFFAEKEFSFPVYSGDVQAIAEAYQLDTVPVSLLIAADGTILAQRVGGMNEKGFEEFLSPVLE